MHVTRLLAILNIQLFSGTEAGICSPSCTHWCARLLAVLSQLPTCITSCCGSRHAGRTVEESGMSMRLMLNRKLRLLSGQ